MSEKAPQDDPSILDTDRLFRRVPPNQLSPLEDGSQRPSTAVFMHQELSINIESLMKAQNRPPEDSLKNYPDHYLTAIVAANVRSHGHPIIKDTEAKEGEPLPDPAHGLVLGKKKKSFANAMVHSHQWVVAPPRLKTSN